MMHAMLRAHTFPVCAEREFSVHCIPLVCPRWMSGKDCSSLSSGHGEGGGTDEGCSHWAHLHAGKILDREKENVMEELDRHEPLKTFH